MMAEEFLSFERVLRELEMEESELKRLISEGEIRAFRDEDKMMFKAEDIAKLRVKSTKAKDVIEELEVAGEEDEDSIPTLESDDLAEELIFEESEEPPAGMATEQIPEVSILEEDEDLEEVAEAGVRSRAKGSAGRVPVRTKGRVARTREAPVEETEGPLFQTLLILSAVVLFYGMFVAFSATTSRPSGVTRWFMSFIQDTFLKG